MPDLDIVGSVELHDDNGHPEGVSLLLTRGMDPMGVACLFREQTRVDLGAVALLRHPLETDAEFEARLEMAIRAMVST